MCFNISKISYLFQYDNFLHYSNLKNNKINSLCYDDSTLSLNLNSYDNFVEWYWSNIVTF